MKALAVLALALGLALLPAACGKRGSPKPPPGAAAQPAPPPSEGVPPEGELPGE